MNETLNPRLDVVFKLLFAAERNRPLLVALLNDVLQPARPMTTVDVVNPEIEKGAPDDRGVVLDILAVHNDGTRTNIEMQAKDRKDTDKRVLYHWARMYRDGIGRGDKYDDLHHCRVVFFLDYVLLPGRRLHSTFRALEVHDGNLLSEGFEVHTIELPKLSGGVQEEDAGILAWARFLAAESRDERRRIAMAHSIIDEANEALDELSRDPKARELAKRREDQLRLYRIELATAQRQGREEGHKEGREEGHKEGLRAGHQDSLRAICEALGVALTTDRQRAIENATADELSQIRDEVLRRRQWPD